MQLFVFKQIELQQILKEVGIKDPSDVQTLRRENEHMREQLERPGHPQRSQTTVGGEAAQVTQSLCSGSLVFI